MSLFWHGWSALYRSAAAKHAVWLLWQIGGAEVDRSHQQMPPPAKALLFRWQSVRALSWHADTSGWSPRS